MCLSVCLFNLCCIIKEHRNRTKDCKQESKTVAHPALAKCLLKSALKLSKFLVKRLTFSFRQLIHYQAVGLDWHVVYAPLLSDKNFAIKSWCSGKVVCFHRGSDRIAIFVTRFLLRIPLTINERLDHPQIGVSLSMQSKRSNRWVVTCGQRRRYDSTLKYLKHCKLHCY